jgi:hypothetical protein
MKTANQHDYIHLKTRLTALVLLERLRLCLVTWRMAAVQHEIHALEVLKSALSCLDRPIAEDARELTNEAKQTTNGMELRR